MRKRTDWQKGEKNNLLMWNVKRASHRVDESFSRLFFSSLSLWGSQCRITWTTPSYTHAARTKHTFAHTHSRAEPQKNSGPAATWSMTVEGWPSHRNHLSLSLSSLLYSTPIVVHSPPFLSLYLVPVEERKERERQREKVHRTKPCVKHKFMLRPVQSFFILFIWIKIGQINS